jgi:hypothetical protein
LAAEIGKSLLENNTTLEHKYQTLQSEFHTHQQETNRHYQHKLTSNEIAIVTLETQNAELVKNYEATLESKEKISRQNINSQQKLTAQVNELYQSLEKAYEKIQEHETYRQEHLKKMILKENSLSTASLPQKTAHYNDEVAELSNQIEQMMNQNQQLLKAKEQIQHQLQGALLQLSHLQSQFSQVQQTKEQFDLLENKFHYQENHIQQLTCMIEEYRSNLSSDCPHQIPNLISDSTGHSSFSSSDEEDVEFDALPQHIKGATSLFSELESAFHKEKDQQQQVQTLGSSEQDLTAVVAVESPRKRYRKIKSSSSSKQQDLLYPSLKADASLIPPMAIYRTSSENFIKAKILPHKSNNFIQRIIQITFDGFIMIWRFFRFFIVVQLAMIIHLFSSKK